MALRLEAWAKYRTEVVNSHDSEQGLPFLARMSVGVYAILRGGRFGLI